MSIRAFFLSSQRMCRRTPGPRLLFLAAVFAVFGGCGEEQLTSVWRDREIAVDGLYSDWTGPLPYLDRQSMYVGVRNDDEYLYVLVKTVDLRAQMKVLRLGLTLWFSPEGKKTGRLGIRYPIGVEDHGIPLYGEGPPRGLSAEQREKIAESLSEMEILYFTPLVHEQAGTPVSPCARPHEGGPLGQVQESRVKVERADSCAIRVAVRDTSEVVVYELRVPLKRTDGSPWAVGAAPGDKIVVEAETGNIRPELREPSTSEPRRRETTGKIRDRGMQRNRERPGGPPMVNPLAEPIRFKARVILARNPSFAR